MAAEANDKDMRGELFLNQMMQRAGVKADEQGNLSVEDALRLKHSINSDIRYCGFNAQEIEKKKEITPEEWGSVRKWYAELVKMYGYHLAPFWYLVAAGLAVFILGYAVQPWRVLGAIAFLLATMWIAAKLGQENGYREGFFAGYENGYEGGINKLLGINEAEALDIRERAVEMEIDEGVVDSFDKRRESRAQD